MYQEQGGLKKVISYASRGLNKAERNYPPHKREFLALKWAVCDKFKDYLFGQQFTVLTDNNPVTYVLTTAKLDATGHRWLAALAAFNFEIRYRPGRSNADADALSRIPGDSADKERIIDMDSFHAICNSVLPRSYVESLTVSPDLVLYDEDPRGSNIGNIVDWKKAQSMDPDIHKLIEYIGRNKKPSRKEIGPNPLLRQFNYLKLIDGVLHRVTTVDEEVKQQLVLPMAHVTTILEALHDDMGHPGKDRTLALVKERFYWPGMHGDIETWIEECGRCTRRKTPTNQRAPLVNITTSSPLELVCMDFLTLEPSKGGQQHILVITDHFTRFAMAVPTKNQLARTTAEAFYNHFIIHYGIPERIHSDQGPNFESKVIRELCTITGMTKSRTTSYHAMGNGMCERFNRTLLNMLGSLEPSKKTNWKAYVGPMVHAYNCTRHESTGQTPYLLMFGRNPRLPIDAAFGLRENEKEPTSKYMKELRDRIAEAYRLATGAADRARAKQKEGYDTRIRGGTVGVGDRVLVKIVAHEGKHKLADRWEHDPYIVVDQRNDEIPVYTVKKENGEGRLRTLHRNLLLPIGFIKDSPTPEPKPKQSPVKKPVPRPRRKKELEHPLPDKPEDVSSDEESENGYLVISQEPVDSDPAITDDTLVQETDTEQEPDREAETGGDAHPSTDTESVDEEDSADRSASQQETEQENTPVDSEVSQPDTDEDEPTPVLVRRSARERRPPARFRTGEYDMSKSAVQSDTPDWEKKVKFITSLAAESDLFQGLQNEAGRTILEILKSSHTPP